MASIKRLHTPSCADRGNCACCWRLDYRPLGVRGPRRRLLFKTRKEAERFQTDTAHRASRGEFVDPAKIPTFAEIAEDWLKARSDHRASHVSNLRSRLDCHLLPRFGGKRLDGIAISDLEKLRDDLRREDYAPSTVNTILRIVGGVFKLAIRRGQYAVNPLDRIDRAHEAAKEVDAVADVNGDEVASAGVDPHDVLDPREIRSMLHASASGLFRTLFTTAALTGARSGELLALRWTDLELPKTGSGRAYIRRSLCWARVPGEEVRPRFYPPKTKAGARAIPVPPGLVSILRRWKLACPASKLDLVFPAADGKPLFRTTVLRVFYGSLRRAGLRQVRFHSLRHSFASSLIAGGAPVTEVQHLCGHANPAITLKIYAHWYRSVETDAVGRLASAVLRRTARKWALSGHSLGIQDSPVDASR